MDTRKNRIREALISTRKQTLWLFEQVPEEFLKTRVHDFYSPIGWHFGHIAMTESYWALEKAMGLPCLDDKLSFLFANTPENTKDNRVHIPDREQIIEYMAYTRRLTLQALEDADIYEENPYLNRGYAWDFAYQHECQHQETICEMLQLIRLRLPSQKPPDPKPLWKSKLKNEYMSLPGGEFEMGTNDSLTYDNERGRHIVFVSPFKLASQPVTAYEWSQFIDSRGYETRELWSDDGWRWKLSENALMPYYWKYFDSDDAHSQICSFGIRWLHPDEPVSGISLFEAQAYANWKGARLPTEEEWEFASAFNPIRCMTYKFSTGENEPSSMQACFGMNSKAPVPITLFEPNLWGISNLSGNVWEWTSSKHLPYPGYKPFPYEGYSHEFMKGEHYISRGGSWATASELLRCTFRNFYVPTYRQGYLGMRLAI